MPGRAPDGIVCLSVSRRPLLRTRRPVKGERSRPVRPRRTGTRRAQDKKQRRVDFHDNLLVFSSSCSNQQRPGGRRKRAEPLGLEWEPPLPWKTPLWSRRMATREASADLRWVGKALGGLAKEPCIATDDDGLPAKGLVRTTARLGLRSSATERLTKDLGKTTNDLVGLNNDLVRLTNVLVGRASPLRRPANRRCKLDKALCHASKVR